MTGDLDGKPAWVVERENAERLLVEMREAPSLLHSGYYAGFIVNAASRRIEAGDHDGALDLVARAGQVWRALVPPPTDDNDDA